MQKTEIMVPQMVLIGSSGKNAGKTTLACNIIRSYKEKMPIYGLKVISIDRVHEQCYRGSEGCGVCSSLEGNFELMEEFDRGTEKDTSKMLEAGATRVFLLKTLRAHASEAIQFFLSLIPDDAIIVCESNSLRKTVEPAIFLFAMEEKQEMKPSAQEVVSLSDKIIDKGKKESFPNFIVERQQANWTITMPSE